MARRCAIQQHVEPNAREVVLLLELDQVVMDARQLQNRFQDILLRDPAGAVFRLRDIGELPQEIDAREMNVDRSTRDEEVRIRLLHLVDDRSRANGDVDVCEHRVLVGDRGPQRAFPAPRKLLAHQSACTCWCSMDSRY